MENLASLTAKHLLTIQAIKLRPEEPFTWASGWKSPIYCDNRRTLSFPEVRQFICNSFCSVIAASFPETEMIAGVATGAIAHGALVADKLNLPFCYVRPTPKGHGLENLIEGYLIPNKKVLIIEDLISTGGSSLKALRAIRNEGNPVLGMLAIFSYGFPEAEKNFNEANCRLLTLSDYDQLIVQGIDMGLILPEDLQTLRQWRTDPGNWKKF
jgi:orotate phosphoribosyltransferase